MPHLHLRPERLSAAWLLQLSWRARKLVLSCGLAGGAVFGTASLLLSVRQYVSKATIVVQSRENMAGLSGFAAQLGVALPTSDQSLSPAVYADLLRSEEIVGQLLSQTFPLKNQQGGVSLAAVLRTQSKDVDEQRFQTLRAIGSSLRTSAEPRTGVISIEFMSEDPVLSQHVVRSLLAELSRFNTEKRQSQARAERQFTEERVAQIRRELESAENGLMVFLQRNASYASSPLLLFEHDRLSRVVAQKQQLLAALSESFERARIDEVRDTPAITVLESPSLALKPRGRGTVSRALFGSVLGMGIAILAAAISQLRGEVAKPQAALAAEE